MPANAGDPCNALVLSGESIGQKQFSFAGTVRRPLRKSPEQTRRCLRCLPIVGNPGRACLRRVEMGLGDPDSRRDPERSDRPRGHVVDGPGARS